MADYIKIHPSDNVAVALRDLPVGFVIPSPDAVSCHARPDRASLTLREPIPRGHKFTLRDLAEGEDVVKYGYPIGHVTRPAPAGTLVDHSCIKTNLSGLLEYKYEPSVIPSPAHSVISSEVEKSPTFKGFRRADGQVGIRNQIWVIPTVGCVNGICQQIVERFNASVISSEVEISKISPLASLGRDDKGGSAATISRMRMGRS